MTADGAGIFDPDLLATCISCGFCLPACPTYALTKQEASSPRGRITLMRALESGALEPDDPTLTQQAGECLGCRACETVCPAGVQYGLLLEQWRDHQWRGRHVPPVAGALRVGTRVTPALAAAGIARRAARSTGPAREDALHLMLGCVERSMFPAVSKAALQVLPDLDVPSGQGCCGALHAHNGGTGEGAQLAHDLGESMPGTIVTTAGGCAAHIAHVLGRERVLEFSEVVQQRWHNHPPTLRPLLVDGRPARVGLQDSCHLRNGLGVSAPARDLIAMVAEYVELPSAGTCCGAAGTYSLLQPERSKQVLAPKLEQVRELALDYVVVVNPGCQRQLLDGLRRSRSTAKVLHLAELLAQCLSDP